MTSKQVKPLSGAVRTSAGAYAAPGRADHRWSAAPLAAPERHGTIRAHHRAAPRGGHVANLGASWRQTRRRTAAATVPGHRPVQDPGRAGLRAGRRPRGGARTGVLRAVVASWSGSSRDGYLNSFFQDLPPRSKPWEDLSWGHELVQPGHLVQAAVAAARRMATIGCCGWRGGSRTWSWSGSRTRGCAAIRVEMALVELFRETGRRAYLDLPPRS
ncbi:hypothetical protein [Nonomuraea rubra]|uniref:hypothetical protein n=1 Tax=Nonomuraea rubra TaxID=46180 RepID=UPI0031EAA34B